MKLTPEDQTRQLELESQYGDNLKCYGIPGVGLVAVAAPPAPAGDQVHPFWKLYAGMKGEAPDRVGLMGTFALECLVHPERAQVASFFARKPAAAVKLYRAARDLCGDAVLANPEPTETEAEEIERLKKAHGDVAWCRVDGVGLVVFAAPENPACYRQFFNDCSNGVDATAPQDVIPQFALDCVVHPARERVEGVLRRLPALAVGIANRGTELCGGDIEELGKASKPPETI